MLCTFSFLSSSVMINWSWLSWVIWLNFYSFLNQIQWFFLPQFCPFFMASRLKNINNRNNFVNFVNIVHFIHFVTILLSFCYHFVNHFDNVDITLRRRVSEVARKGFEKSTIDIRLQVWVRSAAITSISLETILTKTEEFWNLTSLWTIPTFKFWFFSLKSHLSLDHPKF